MLYGQSQALTQRPAEFLYAGMTDAELLARFNGSRDESAERSFAALVHRHGPLVLRVCLQVLGDRHRAEDAFQATFLVLARRSGAIRRPELLSHWLYGVALRTSWEAKMRDGRKRRRETPGALAAAGGASGGDAGRPEAALIRREEVEALHEEVSRLPERYRLPVVLCELEGLTYQEAALRLRCPVSTVGVRLSRARERLRVRLIRRGILPAAAVMNGLFGAEAATAWVPSALATATARAAAGFAAGDPAAAGLASVTAVAIARAVLRAMALARLKVAAHTLLLLALTAGAGSLAVVRPSRSSAAPVAPQAQAPAVPAAAPQVMALADPRVEQPPARSGTPPDAPDEPREPDAARAGRPAAVPVLLARLERAVRDEHARGELLFSKEWAPNDPMSPDGDGLGPVYNETSCVACHGLGGPGGAGPGSKNVLIVTAVESRGQGVPKGLERVHPGFRGTRSTVLHRFGTDPAYAAWRRPLYDVRPNAAQGAQKDGTESVEDRIRKAAEQAAPGRRLQRALRLKGVALNVTERNTPALFGAGRIDAIPSEVLAAEAERQPKAVRGRVGRDRNGRAGRFGWKAQVANLHEFVRGACAGELGLEVAGHSQPASPLAPNAKAKGPDMTEAQCDALVAYVRALPAPVVIDPSGPQGTKRMEHGRQVFAEAGCATCHTPSLGAVRGVYSDLLLHEMGPALSDAGVSYGVEGPPAPGGPSPGEWRTPPLWGFRDSGPYLHDGRAETLDEAVALHGGQGAQAARAYFALADDARADVEAFLKSLVAPAATAAPGVMLAAELEARVEPEELRQAEAAAREEREEAAAREERRLRDAQRQARAAEALRRARRRLPLAMSLEKMGKTAAALEFYREIARNAAGTEEARTASARVAALAGKPGSP
jgi:RNA polymerase sigma factor (sigma-70 family)